MPSHDRAREIPLLKRAAILTLYWYGEKNWAEISALLKVNPEKAKAICARAKERATNPDDFDDVLRHLENPEQPSQNKSQQPKDQRPVGVGNRNSSRVVAPPEPKGLRILERSGQHEYRDEHKVSRPNTVRDRNLIPSTESKALGMLEEDLSLSDNGFVSCFGSLEGVTMMRDMDWR